MKAFGLTLDDEIVRPILEHAERDYPAEAVGLVLGPAEGPLERVVPLKNVQDKYHELDAEQFPRTSHDAFRIDELERMRVLEGAGGLTERVLYHSHPDAGAYFSPEDRANAHHQGIELMPGVVFVVVSVREGKAVDMAAFRYEQGRLLETRLPLGPVESLPDLEMRAMEGQEASRPIRPVGGRLVPRCLTPAESETMGALAEGRCVKLETTDQVLDVYGLARGLLSPLTGYMRSADVFSVDLKGRLQSGTPWRSPLRLELAKKRVPPVSGGAIVELCTPEGEPIALMVVVSFEAKKDKVALGGPVYAYDGGPLPDAAATRAALLERDAKRVLAIPKSQLSRELDRDAYDACLLPDDPELPLAPCHRGAWLQAVFAQNQGATHIAVSSEAVAKQIVDTLEIEPV